MKLTVCELFAGVGGFRLGLEKSGWKTIWANQYEPSTKKQHAAECYINRFGSKNFSNEDIDKVNPKKIPNHTLLVGGFPCQDYSVATTQAKGIVGKKGVLWWNIHKIIKEKEPSYILLENVDRLLYSPSKQRGRDFAIILACLRDEDYSVEWRMINAADYGFPQKRRRTFIFAFKNSTKFGKKMNEKQGISWIKKGSFFENFRVETVKNVPTKYPNFNEMKLHKVSTRYSQPFSKCGFMTKEGIFNFDISQPKRKPKPLKSILEKKINKKYYIDENLIQFRNLSKERLFPKPTYGFGILISGNKRATKFFHNRKDAVEYIKQKCLTLIKDNDEFTTLKAQRELFEPSSNNEAKIIFKRLKKWEIPKVNLKSWFYVKTSKHETRRTKKGYEFPYDEGPIPFPDNLNVPSRTMLTSEGVLTSPNRITHIIKDPITNKYRTLTPVECERLNGFDDNWTKYDSKGEEFSDSQRYFFMGNALVVGLIEKMGRRIKEIINE